MELVKPGESRLIRVDGQEAVLSERPTIAMIRRRLRAQSLDTITIDRENRQIMAVDDTGMIDGKPVNEKATLLYRQICVPGSMGTIHGDVMIINDSDFGSGE